MTVAPASSRLDAKRRLEGRAPSICFAMKWSNGLHITGDNAIPLISMRGITKRYPGVLALDRVDLDLLAGEVHIVAGENGAGKSTLMKVLGGSVRPDSGSIQINGNTVVLDSPLKAIQEGITVVHQEFALCPHLSVAENIFLGQEPGGSIFIDKKAMLSRSDELLASLGAKCSARDIVSTLGTAQMQLVEIARALKGRFHVLILDEPTAALSDAEIAELFRVVKSLREKGSTIVYISHRLEEFAEIGDRVTVMRNGCKVETMPVREATIPKLVTFMAGKEMSELFPARKPYSGAGAVSAPDTTQDNVLLRVEGLCQGRRLQNISLVLHPGEIIGVAGLAGSGRTRLLRTLFGLEPLTGGEINLAGARLTGATATQTIAAGMGLVPEDRKTQGLLLDQSIARNISIANLQQVSTGPFVSARRETLLAEAQKTRTTIKAPSVNARVGTLSGGNQQKVVLAKWLARECRVLLLDEPARGVDVGARYEIFSLIAKCAEEGKGVIMVSSYLPELLGMADRILVMYRGTLAAQIPARGATQEAILHAASVGALS